MKIGCAALYPITRYGFPYSLDNYLKAIVEMHSAGFEYCELEINVDLDLEEYGQRVREVSSILRQNHMVLSAVIGVVQGGFSTKREIASAYLHKFERLCQVTADLGCEVVCICAYMPPEIKAVPGTEPYRGAPPMQVHVPAGFNWEVFWSGAVNTFSQMAREAARHGQKLVIENRVGDFINTSDGVLRLIEEAGEPNGGCLLDVAHAHATKEHIDLVIPKLKRRLMYVHLADNDGSQPYHLPAGKGNIDFRSVFRSLKAIGYDSYVNVDYGGVSPEQILKEVTTGLSLFNTWLTEVESANFSPKK